MHCFFSSLSSLILVISGFKLVNSASKQLVSPAVLRLGTKGGFTLPCRKNAKLARLFFASDKCLYNLLWQTVDNLFDLLKELPVGFCKIEMLLHTKSSIFSSKPLFWILGRKMWDVRTYSIQFGSRISDLDKKIADKSPTLFWKRLRNHSEKI